MIDISRLLVLRAAAEAGSLSAAARRLRVTPSAVSQQVAALERALGVPLLERTNRGVRPTGPGRLLVGSAHAITAELASAERHIAEIAAGRRGRLLVASFSSAGQRLLPRAVSQLADDHPDADITVLESEPEDTVPKVTAGDADLGIVYHFFTPQPPTRWGVGEALSYQPLRRDPVRVVLPADHRLAGRAGVALADLADERWVQGWGHVGEMLDRYAAVAGFVPRVACYSSDYLFTQSVVAAGMGVALVPDVGLATHQPGIAILPVAAPTPIRYVGAVQPRSRWHSPLARELLTRLRDTVAD